MFLMLPVLASFLAAGIPYWLVPYDEVSLPGSLLHPGLFTAGISALLLCMYGVASFRRSTAMVAASVGAAVAARVMAGIAQEPASHSLWPFEVAIASVVGVVCATPGAIVGSLIARWFPHVPGARRS